MNACGFNQRLWVFAGGLTNVATVITVTDTATGVTRTYANAQNTPFQPIQDTSAFTTCFAGSIAGATSAGMQTAVLGEDAARAAARAREEIRFAMTSPREYLFAPRILLRVRRRCRPARVPRRRRSGPRTKPFPMP